MTIRDELENQIFRRLEYDGSAMRECVYGLVGICEADGQEPEDLQCWLYLGALSTNPEPKMHFRVLFGTSLICFGNLRISMGNRGFVAKYRSETHTGTAKCA